jgi:hypothetical protein
MSMISRCSIPSGERLRRVSSGSNEDAPCKPKLKTSRKGSIDFVEYQLLVY